MEELKDTIDNTAPIERIDGTVFVRTDGLRQWAGNAKFPLRIQSGNHSLEIASLDDLDGRANEVREFCNQAINEQGWFMVPKKP